ncbi:MAG: rRNA pseudouridine synthase, partial [Bacteroidales bacterium]|nr:rRNA pseudouridine synthase [Bacteroidales bacterium]
TNDGKLAKTLTHPKHEIKKIYHVVLNKPLTITDMKTVATGIELEDGLIKVDKIAYIEDGTDKTQIGIEIHSGRNRIVRRIFVSLNYKIVRLDRVAFAGLTKKDTPRGKWRFLKDHEINILKMLS